MSVFVLLFTVTTLLNPIVRATKGCDAIFNFGDSNSDTGGLAASIVAPPPPYGITFPGRPAGRFSDGRLIIDFIAKSFGLPFLHAYLDSLEANFSNGVNFATASSTIKLPPNALPLGIFSPFFLGIQYTQFEKFKHRTELIRSQGDIFASLVPREEYFTTGLYTFDIGQNDLTALALAGLTMLQANAFVPHIVDSFSEDVKKIYNLGARSFWIHNTGPLGCLPILLVRFPLALRDSNGCVASYNEVSQFFNLKLKEAVVQLRKDLPQASFIYVDIYSVKYSLFSNPLKYGFRNPLVSCCGYGGQYNFSTVDGCGKSIHVNGNQIFQGSCDNRPTRVIWDGVHYTDAANKFVFDQISTGAFSDPPIPLNMACDRKY